MRRVAAGGRVCESGTNPSRCLTPEGRRLAAEVAGIEEQLYTVMDAACEGLDTDAVLAFLHRVIDPLPFGPALNSASVTAEAAGRWARSRARARCEGGPVHLRGKAWKSAPRGRPTAWPRPALFPDRRYACRATSPPSPS